MPRLLKRWYVWALLLLAIVIAGMLLVPFRGRITQANFDRINYGMTEAEVRDILGEPDCIWPDFVKTHIWGVRGRNRICVTFDANGAVAVKLFRGVTTWEYLCWLWEDILYKTGIAKE